MLIRLLLVSALGSACVDNASATTQASSGSDHGRRPPQEALAACATSSAGETCAFDVDTHHVTGICRTGPDGSGPLACAPARPPPPPEAFAACANSTADATCAFDIDGHHATGTCSVGPDAADPLACAPAR